MIQTIKECSQSRHALRMLLEVEIKNRIHATRLGMLWWVLDPLILLAIYTFVIQMVLGRGGPGFPMFVLTGLVVWQAFAKGISQAAGIFNRYSNLIRVYNTPLVAYVTSAVVSNIFYVLFGVVIVMAFNWSVVGWHTFFLIPVIILLIIISLAIALPVACIGVWVKDISLMVTYILRIGFYASPVLYSVEMVMSLEKIPHWAKVIYGLNPIGYLITIFRQILLEGQAPDIMSFVVWLFVFLVMIQLGLLLLRRLHNSIPKVV